MKRIRKFLYEIVILIFPVMLGVYLGLLANDWSQAKEAKQQTDKTLKNILQEVTYNEQITDSSLAYFRQLRDSILNLKNREISPSTFTFWKGLNPPLLKNASFQSASISGTLGNLDLDMLEQLTTVYDFQQELKTQGNYYLQSVTNKIGSDNFDNHQYLIILENYAHDQIYAGESLNGELNKAKQLIANYLNEQ